MILFFIVFLIWSASFALASKLGQKIAVALVLLGGCLLGAGLWVSLHAQPTSDLAAYLYIAGVAGSFVLAGMSGPAISSRFSPALSLSAAMGMLAGVAVISFTCWSIWSVGRSCGLP